MKTILCFGDSNTNGSNPDKGPARHPYDVRWPGRLQRLLGEDYYVIEEGLGGRTTVWDDPLEADRCGKDFLPAALRTHRPLDLVILSLGTNDCKSIFSANARTITRGMGVLVNMVKSFDYGPDGRVPQILLVSPIHMGPDIANSIFETFDEESAEKVKQLAGLYENLAAQTGCGFLDAAKVAGPGSDQLHMDGESHRRLAEALVPVIREMLQDSSSQK